MKKYNKTNPIIYNTLQAYRWDRYDYLVKLHEKAKNENFIIGINWSEEHIWKKNVLMLMIKDINLQFVKQNLN